MPITVLVATVIACGPTLSFESSRSDLEMCIAEGTSAGTCVIERGLWCLCRDAAHLTSQADPPIRWIMMIIHQTQSDRIVDALGSGRSAGVGAPTLLKGSPTTNVRQHP